MLYLSGCVRPQVLTHPQAGVMLQPGMGNRPDLSRTAWAADNGCFAAGARFDLHAWRAWLDARRAWRSTCLFAVAPDVVGDAAATWARSREILVELRRRGWRAALVAQDGIDREPRVRWSRFDCLFIGGTTAFKLSSVAAALAAEARARGKWVHMGRVNSLVRLRYAASIGCHSADGTFLAYGPERNWPKLRAWLAVVNDDSPTRPWAPPAHRQSTLWAVPAGAARRRAGTTPVG